MQTHVLHTSQKLEKDDLIVLYVKNLKGDSELRTCKVLKKHKEGGRGECFMYSLRILGL